MEYSFNIPGEPASKSRARFARRGNKVVTYTDKKTYASEHAVATAFMGVAPEGYTPPQGRLYEVEAIFYCETRQRRDVDNMCKLILDGLNGVAFVDDNYVMSLIARKVFVEKGEGRTEVILRDIGESNPPSAICSYCGIKFLTYESTKARGIKSCSIECAKRATQKKLEKVCLHCGIDFKMEKTTSRTKFCSKECGYDHKKVDVDCNQCGKTFQRARSVVRDINLCSTECTQLRQAQRAKDRRSKYFPGTCEVCGGGTTRKEYKHCAEHRPRRNQNSITIKEIEDGQE